MSKSKPFRLSIITVSPGAEAALRKTLVSEDMQPLASDLVLRVLYVGGEEWNFHEAEVVELLSADMVLLDLMGADKTFQERLPALLVKAAPSHVVVINTDMGSLRSLTRLGDFKLSALAGMKKMGPGRVTSEDEGSIRAMDGEKMLGMVRMLEKVGKAIPLGPIQDARNYIWLGSYWRYGNQRNLRSLLCLVMSRYGKKRRWPKPAPPEAPCAPALYDLPEGRVFGSLAELDAALGCAAQATQKGRVGILFAAGTYPVDTHQAVKDLVQMLRDSFAVYPVAVASGDANTFQYLRTLFIEQPSGAARIDCLINLNAFRLGQGPMGGEAQAGERFLADLDVPYLHPFFISKRDRASWINDIRGLQSGEFMLHYFLPELDGAARMLPLAAASPLGSLEILPERVEMLSRRVARLVRLRRAAPAERRVAIMLYDYPPGEASAGAAAFLDSFASAAAILRALKAAGYDTREVSADELRSLLIQGGRCNVGGFTAAAEDMPTLGAIEYDRLFDDSLEDQNLRAQIEQSWGRFPGDVNRSGTRLVLPGIQLGKVFVGFQPPRVDGEAVDAARYHDPYLPPHHQYTAMYRYLERIFQADAVLHIGTHGTLEFLPGKELAPSGTCCPDRLIGSIPHFYYYYCGNPAEAMVAKRKAHAVMIGYLQPPYGKAGLPDKLKDLSRLREEYGQARTADPERCRDIEQDIQDRFEELGWEWRGVDELDRALYDIASSLIPLGHHTAGQPYDRNAALDFIRELLKDEPEGFPPLWRSLASAAGYSYDDMRAQPFEHAKAWDELSDQVKAQLERNIPPDNQGLAEAEADWQACCRLYTQLTHEAEIPALLACLGGRFLPSGLAGDPYRSPEVLPSGRNLHQFDPRRAPSPSALRRGRAVAENTLKEYYERNGEYPEQVAVVLWGLEASKTEGETVAQIFQYLGVRIKPGRSLWEAALESIPLAELGRPRVDVSVQISGFFRDLFPNLMTMIDDAFSLVAGLKEEPDNYIAAHVAAQYERLRAQGVSEEDAIDRARARIFGPPPGTYGTGITTMVNAGSWKEEEEIALRYKDAMQHAYTKRRYGVADREALDANLARVRLVSQIRSSQDYEITDLDHYYEHFGGLAKSVELAAGHKAALYVSDSIDGAVRTEDIVNSIRRGVHARLLNPKWQDAVLGTELRGVQEVADRLENLVGLAAGTAAVPSAVFNLAAEQFAFNQLMRERLKENNPYALRECLERLLEAAGRGYWEATEEQLTKLRSLYRDLEDELE
jgi:cobaltochelatase CobN